MTKEEFDFDKAEVINPETGEANPVGTDPLEQIIYIEDRIRLYEERAEIGASSYEEENARTEASELKVLAQRMTDELDPEQKARLLELRQSRS